MRLRKPEITFVFSFEPGLEMLSSIFLLPQQFFDTRECAERRRGARRDSFFSAVKVIPGQ